MHFGFNDLFQVDSLNGKVYDDLILISMLIYLSTHMI